MLHTPALWYILLAVSAPIAAASAVVAWQRRPGQGSEAVTAMLLAVAWWSATYLGELLAVTLDGKLFWARMEWLGSLLIPVAWLVFTLEYTGHDEYVSPRTVGALLVPWGVSVVLVWTNPLHHLVRVPHGVESVNGLLLLDQSFGPWFFVVAGYTYVLVLIGAALLGKMATSTRVVYRGQALALLGASLTPLWVNVYSVFLSTVDLTPFAFTVTGVSVLVAMSRYELLDATPVAALTASQAVIESMDEGVLVVDTRGNVVNANAAAGHHLGRPTETLVGEPVGEVFGSVGDPDAGEEVLTYRRGATEVVLEVSNTELRNRRGRVVGRTLVLRDVTDRHCYRQRIEVLNRVLRHNLRTEMNVVTGYAETLRDEASREGERAIDEIDGAARELVGLANRAREIEELIGGEDGENGVSTVPDVVDGMVATVRQEVPIAQIVVETVPDEQVPCDPLLEPVLVNLVESLVTFGSEDPVVHTWVSSDDWGVVVTVTDDDGGIPVHERAVIDAESETPLDHGSGLGLWLVKWGLDRIDGSLEFEETDDGTVARLYVPHVTDTHSWQAIWDDDRTPLDDGDAFWIH